MYILDAYSKTIKKFKEEKFKIMKTLQKCVLKKIYKFLLIRSWILWF